MTDKQWRLLETIERFDGHGTIEVQMELEFAPEVEGDEASEAKAWRLTQFVVDGMVRVLVKKGLATDGPDGYGVTDRGRELLAKREKRKKK